MGNPLHKATRKRTADRESKGEASVLIVNPSADVYGSDLQMLESVSALVEVGLRVTVLTPSAGPLIPLLQERGADVEHLEVPVLRRSNASPRGLVALAGHVVAAIPRMVGAIRRIRPDVIYANTMTIPWWSLVARLCRIPVVVHVHEAESDDPRPVRLGLNTPLILANKVIVNSRTSLGAMIETVPSLERCAVLIHNGVHGPPDEPMLRKAPSDSSYRVAIIGRLSPRKATDVALKAVGILRAAGRDVTIDVVGTAFEGYEWFVEDLRRIASEPELAGAVDFLGYRDPVWPILERCDAFVAPSVRESLGNAVIEAQLAARPVVASATSGHFESVEDGESGLLVPVGDVDALAQAIARLMDDENLASRLAEAGRRSATDRFSPQRYGEHVVELIRSMAR